MLATHRVKAVLYAGVGLLLLVLGALACESDHMRARELPLWTCPTAVPPATRTPEPTSTVLPGTPEPTPAATYTPYPSPTPFELLSDFPLGKHVRIGSVGGIGLGIWVWMDNVQIDGPFFITDETTGASVEWWVASWDVTVENASLTREYEFYPQMQLYVVEIVEADGTTFTRGAWGPSGEAADFINLPHLELTEDKTLLHPGDQVTVRAAALIPAPEVWRLGYVLDPLDTVDIEEMLSAQSLGSNVGIWINSYDNTCIGEITPGAPGTPGAPPTYGYLLARHPVNSVNITRGYGCSADYTGEMGTSCGAATPWWHNGVDYSIAKGSPYFDAAADSGSVQYAGDNPAGPDCSNMSGSEEPHNGYGNYVKHVTIVDGHELQIWGAHLSAFNIGSGNPTAPDQILGFTGSTGCSTGPHLHFSVKVDGLYVDPLTLIP
jgi:murein DD-endopeptidase MepM/ murein hydrolase activator NlpD